MLPDMKIDFQEPEKPEVRDMGRYNIYIEKKVYAQFQRICDEKGYSISKMVEALMVGYIKKEKEK